MKFVSIINNSPEINSTSMEPNAWSDKVNLLFKSDKSPFSVDIFLACLWFFAWSKLMRFWSWRYFALQIEMAALLVRGEYWTSFISPGYLNVHFASLKEYLLVWTMHLLLLNIFATYTFSMCTCCMHWSLLSPISWSIGTLDKRLKNIF